jgi:hypothetical protein
MEARGGGGLAWGFVYASLFVRSPTMPKCLICKQNSCANGETNGAKLEVSYIQSNPLSRREHFHAEHAAAANKAPR